jgi:hypothetical protein
MPVDRTRRKSVILGHPVRWIIAILVIGLGSAAHAAPEGVVLESHTGERHPDANRLLSPILDELATREYIAGPGVVGRRFEQRVSRPSTVPNALPQSFGAQVDQGHKDYISGRFKEAIQLLGPLVQTAQANPGAFAQNQGLREKLQKALFALALSNQRIGDSEAARAAVAEILRSFPNASVSRQQYGPQAFSFFEEEKKQILAAGMGTIVVKASNEAAVVFINERFVAAGGSARETLLAGTYRVFVQVGKQISRVHLVTVTANNEAAVTIDVGFDQQVHSSPEWTGFLFPDVKTRDENESVFAAAFANSLESSKAAVVIGIDTVRSKPAVVVSVVLLDGRESRRASVPLDPDPSIDRLKMLGRFAAGENAVPGIEIEPTKAARKTTSADSGKKVDFDDLGRRRERSSAGGGEGMWGGWKWLTGIAGLGAMGVGGYLLSVDGDCTDEACTYNRETSVSGWLTLSSGIVLTGISVYLFVRGGGEATAADRGAFVVPTRDGVYAGYRLPF